jgi:hypothetical protein
MTIFISKGKSMLGGMKPDKERIGTRAEIAVCPIS